MMTQKKKAQNGNYRWYMFYFATTINYLDRQVLSLTWKGIRLIPLDQCSLWKYCNFIFFILRNGVLVAGRLWIGWIRKGYGLLEFGRG